MKITIDGRRVNELCKLHDISPDDGNMVVALLRQIYHPRSLRMVSYLSTLGTRNDTWELWTGKPPMQQMRTASVRACCKGGRFRKNSRKGGLK